MLLIAHIPGFTKGLLSANNGVLQKLDPGAAVALGAPLHVRMFVPLWVVNATSLPVAAWVVPVQPPRQPSEREGQAAEDLMDTAESIRLKILETEAVDAPPSPGTRSRRYHNFFSLLLLVRKSVKAE